MINNLANKITTYVNHYNITRNTDIDFIFLQISSFQNAVNIGINNHGRDVMIELLEKTLLFLKSNKEVSLDTDIKKVRKLLYGDKNEK